MEIQKESQGCVFVEEKEIYIELFVKISAQHNFSKVCFQVWSPARVEILGALCISNELFDFNQ